MKGLLIKDLMLMKNQKRFFLIMAFIAVTFLMSGTNELFAIMYLTMICSLFVLSTFSYDEYENGGAFLMTLPITRKQYVMGKYLLSVVLGVCSWTLISIATFAVDIKRNTVENALEWWGIVAIYLLFTFLMLALMIPVQIKFGAEKSRIALIGIIGVFVLAAFGLEKLCEITGLDVTPLLYSLKNMNFATQAIAAIIALLVAMFISVNISIKLMEKKEY